MLPPSPVTSAIPTKPRFRPAASLSIQTSYDHILAPLLSPLPHTSPARVGKQKISPFFVLFPATPGSLPGRVRSRPAPSLAPLVQQVCSNRLATVHRSIPRRLLRVLLVRLFGAGVAGGEGVI